MKEILRIDEENSFWREIGEGRCWFGLLWILDEEKDEEIWRENMHWNAWFIAWWLDLTLIVDALCDWSGNLDSELVICWD